MIKTTQHKRRRFGFSLVELLMVIAIIGVLTSMAIGVMANAQNEAKASATESRIVQIESLFAIALEDYEVRRLPISVRELGRYVDRNPVHGLNAQGVADKKVAQVRNLRRRILQDIINAENPRPFLNLSGVIVASDDVGVFPSKIGPFLSPVPGGFDGWLRSNYPRPQYPKAHHPVTNPYLWERLTQLTPARVQSYGPMKTDPVTTNVDFDLPGEYLYAILERMDIDGTPAIELLGDAAIGNTDEPFDNSRAVDSYPEVVDAWGNPLQMRIWQIESDPLTNDTSVSNDIYGDTSSTIDFDTGDITVAPGGYVGLDSSIPRELHKIRFEVLSPRLGRHN